MALKEQSQTKRPQGLQTQGPVSADQGYNPSALPPNPSDEIFQGRALPIIPAQAVTGRRPFSEPTKSPLHFDEGRGTDERVSSRRPGGSPGASQGEDKNKYSQGPNEGKTLGGADIYGT